LKSDFFLSAFIFLLSFFLSSNFFLKLTFQRSSFSEILQLYYFAALLFCSFIILQLFIWINLFRGLALTNSPSHIYW